MTRFEVQKKPKPKHLCSVQFRLMVEVTGLEPTTFWSLTRRATKLRYTSVIQYFSNNRIIILKIFKKANSF